MFSDYATLCVLELYEYTPPPVNHTRYQVPSIRTSTTLYEIREKSPQPAIFESVGRVVKLYVRSRGTATTVGDGGERRDIGRPEVLLDEP